MIVGRIVDRFDAVVPVVVEGSGQAVAVEAIVDTGFTGHLTLPPEQIISLGLQSRGARHAIMAEGRTVLSRAFVALMEWDGEMIRVQVLEAPGSPLVGMRLLEGFRITIDVEVDGAVRIERLDERLLSN